MVIDVPAPRDGFVVAMDTRAIGLAVIEVAAKSQTPMIALGAAIRIVQPMDDQKRWVFKTPQNDQQMAFVIVSHMLGQGVKSAGFIGFADAYGEGWWNEFSKLAETRGIKVVANERYQRNDTSVTGQVLKLIAATLLWSRWIRHPEESSP